jgi:transposase-like protein
LGFSQRLKEGAEHLERMAGQFRGGAEGLFGAFGRGGAAAIGVAATAAALGELYHLASEAAEHAHEIGALSSALGISTGQLRAWMRAAGEAGVNTDQYAKTLERTAIAAEKAADEQRKLVVEAAKVMAVDATGGAARGSSAFKNAPPTNALLDNTAPSKLIDTGALVKDTAALRAFAQMQYELYQRVRENQKETGQIPQPLVSFDTFLGKLRQRMAETTPEAAKLREEFAKLGGNPPIKDLAEGLDRLAPKFKDTFTDVGVKILDDAGKMRDFAKIMRDSDIALSHLDESKALAFARETGGKGAIDPVELEFRKRLGEAGGGV